MTGIVLSGKTGIPVRNLWLLMFYASTLYQSNTVTGSFGAEDRPDDLPDLVALILADAVERRLQRSLSRTYTPSTGALTRVRGRIDVLATESRQLLANGRVACRYHDRTVDTPVNRMAYAALRVAAATVRDKALSRRCAQLSQTLQVAGVSTAPMTSAVIESVRAGRNELADVGVLDAARLVLTMNIPNEDAGAQHRWPAERDVRLIRTLYEAAVRGFYRAALPPGWTTYKGERKHSWPVDSCSAGAMAILPIMRTDTTLESETRRIIIDTKFAEALKPNRFGTRKLAAQHIFQLYAYVQSQIGRDTLATTAEGVLLYPTVSEDVDEWLKIQGHRYRILSVNLAGHAADIRSRLMSVVDPLDER